MTEFFRDLDFRCVTKDDYEKVMDVRRGIYRGNDDLPSCYHSIINSSNARGYAAVYKGKFIAFCIAYIIDDGQTFVSRANRVTEEYEGRGIMKWLLQKVKDVVMNTTTVQYEASTNTRDTKSTIRQIDQGKCNITADREMKDFITEKSLLKCTLDRWPDENLQLVKLDENSLRDLIGNEDLTTRLFGMERIVVDGVPYKAMQSNVPYMLSDSIMSIGSNLKHKEKALLTFGHGFPVVQGLLYFIDVYSNIEDNLIGHVLKHVQDSATSEHINVSIRMFYDKHIPYARIKTEIVSINFTERPLIVNGCLCVERKLR